MDVLTDVLRLTSLGNAVITRSNLVAPWGLQIPSKVRVAIHLIQRGECWLRVAGSKQPLRLAEGDVVLIPSAISHVLSDAPDTPPLPLERGLALAQERTRLGPKPDGPTASATLLCAEIKFDHHAAPPLASVLPDVVHIQSDAAERGEALASLTRILLREAGSARAGSEVMVARLLDALLILIVRHWLDSQESPRAGWLGALQNPKIGRALGAMHENPGHAWSVAELADRAGMSRAAFARQFPALVGQTPLAYLTHWRMSVASKLLRSTTLSVEEVSLRAGYESVTAFGNAFRRHFSISPGRYRTKAE